MLSVSLSASALGRGQIPARFQSMPLLIGGKAMAYSGLRRAGPTSIVSSARTTIQNWPGSTLDMCMTYMVTWACSWISMRFGRASFCLMTHFCPWAPRSTTP